MAVNVSRIDNAVLDKAVENIDRAETYLKIAHNFSVQYFGQCVPKNAVYGRLSKFVYIYIDNFKQFYHETRTAFNVYILDSRSKSGTWHKNIVKKHTQLYYDILSMIVFHNMENVKVEYQLLTNRIEKPRLRTTGQYLYKGSPKQLLNSRSADYGGGITDRSVSDGLYIPHDPHGNKTIRDKQNSYSKTLEKHYAKYSHALSYAHGNKEYDKK